MSVYKGTLILFKMADPNQIATLIPCDNSILAQDAFRLALDSRRYPQPAPRIAHNPSISRGESIPSPKTSQTCHPPPTIQLTFSEEPKDLIRGYSFGTSSRCDFRLGQSGTSKISRRHFWIKFDENHRLKLTDESSHGTAVTYGGAGDEKPRTDFSWTLLGYDGHRISNYVTVHVIGLVFKIEFPNHESCQSTYHDNVASFLAKGLNRRPTLNTLGTNSNHETRAATKVETRAAGKVKTGAASMVPFYCDVEELGRGSFGRVVKVVDVITGNEYARKTFYKRSSEKDWLKRIKNEICIMMNYKHVSMAPPYL